MPLRPHLRRVEQILVDGQLLEDDVRLWYEADERLHPPWLEATAVELERLSNGTVGSVHPYANLLLAA